ncbi:Uncharacterized membrane protein, predicted cobalt tansporter CbtA [Nocardioides scoriae]|uniref:Uncharacterized membrane protein, predicted cobalt tansporter CbtA n=1 Tax=Nocardioides scoriae TaxID=642780 RepID=A0A1H1P1Q4_9ACTN|nr:CbtA family protein [Nocardioides scoriae]SDS04945.1 Uncharacterized membrane protein, predicted cobalt tansporter CbtA [Nocardioides scoriae]
MTARAFLVRGLLAGLLAGFATFLVAYQVGEPQVEAAIALESSGEHSHDESADTGSASAADPGAEAAAGHSHDEADAVVSRGTQRTWGLLTGSLAVGTALGGLVALAAATAMGRLGRLGATGSTAVVALAGFVGVALVPFWKYPATPPAVGSADTIGQRSDYYFVFLLVSVLAVVGAVVLGARLLPRLGAWTAVLVAAGAYLVLVTVVGLLMPTVNEVGDFPADTLWYFRRASLLTLATMWAAIGILLTGFLRPLEQRTTERTRRRELAASL